MKPRCSKCGRRKVLAGRTTRYLYCPPCNREAARARKRFGSGATPAPVAGARERLARFLDDHWHEALPRLAELMGRSAAFGVSIGEEQRA